MDASLGRFSSPVKKPSGLTRLAFFLIVSMVLMIVDHRGSHLYQIRKGLSVLVYPVQVLASVPVAVGRWTGSLFTSDDTMKKEYQSLRDEYPLLLAKLQKYESLVEENNRLRRLLASAERVADRAIVAELLEVHPDPFSRKIVINRGSKDDIYIGQPVIDAFGVMGQVTHVGVFTSIVTLIVDPSHAIPVQINRNGLRTIAVGKGTGDILSLPYLTRSADIKEGDLLVTSGMGGTFPAGYPVATVAAFQIDPNEEFLDVTAKPKAQISHNREVLVIWPGQPPANTDTVNESQHPQ